MNIPYGTDDGSSSSSQHEPQSMINRRGIYDYPNVAAAVPLHHDSISFPGSSSASDGDIDYLSDNDNDDDDEHDDYYSNCNTAHGIILAQQQRMRTRQLVADYQDYISSMDDKNDGAGVARLDENNEPPEIRVSQRYHDNLEMQRQRSVEIERTVTSLQDRNRRVGMDFDSLRSSLNLHRREEEQGTDGGSRSSAAGMNVDARSSNIAFQRDSIGELYLEDGADDEPSIYMSKDNYEEEEEEEMKNFQRTTTRRAFLAGIAVPCIAFIAASVIKSSRTRFPTCDQVGIITTCNRSQGWLGQTYSQASTFCTSRGLSLCSYNTLCPHGPGSHPTSEAFLQGSGDTPGIANEHLIWVATSDGGDPNSWVQVGTEDICLTYDYIHGTSPPWGVSGEDNEPMTRYNMCCPPRDVNDDSNIKTDDQNEGANKGKKIQQLDAVWYKSSTMIASYNEALSFCSKQGTGGDSKFPCSFESYCPDGPHAPPVTGGPSEGPSSSALGFWSHILDERGHGLVQVGGGQDIEQMCKVRYIDDVMTQTGLLHSKDYQEAMSHTQHIMCCEL